MTARLVLLLAIGTCTVACENAGDAAGHIGGAIQKAQPVKAKPATTKPAAVRAAPIAKPGAPGAPSPDDLGKNKSLQKVGISVPGGDRMEGEMEEEEVQARPADEVGNVGAIVPGGPVGPGDPVQQKVAPAAR